MAKISLAEQIELASDWEQEAAEAGHPGRASICAAIVRSLKTLDYQILEERRKVKREKRAQITLVELAASDPSFQENYLKAAFEAETR